MTRLFLMLGLLFSQALHGDALEVIDDTGRTVRLPQPAGRIVTLSPHGTELVFAAGAGERLVAVASHSDWPPSARDKPTIGSYGGLDRERLLALSPDLVIAWDSGNRPGDLAWLDRMGIAVYRSEPVLLEQIAGNIEDIGRLAGTLETASSAAGAFRHDIATPCPVQPARGFMQLADSPLITVGRRHWLHEALRLAGVENVFSGQDKGVFSTTSEDVYTRQPELQLGIMPASSPLARRTIILDADHWSRPGPRLAQGMKRLCRQLQTKASPIGVESRQH